MPALLAALDESSTLTWADRARILLALGSLSGRGEEPSDVLIARLTDNLRGQQDVVQVSAAFALALLQLRDSRCISPLLERKLLPGEGPATVGACALALGLLRLTPRDPGHRRVVRHLRGQAGEGMPDDCRACILLAMGLTRDTTFLEDLHRVMRAGTATSEPPVPDQVLAAAVAAVGKIGEVHPGTVTRETATLLGRLRNLASVYTRRSIAIACGQIGSRPGAMPSVRTVLFRLLQDLVNDEDATTRDYAVLSLGRLAATSTRSDRRRRALAHLTRALARDSEDRASVALLALALFGRSSTSARGESEGVRTRLTRHLRDAEDVDSLFVRLAIIRERGVARHVKRIRNLSPLVVALGVLGDRAAIPLLRRLVLDPSRSGRLRGYSALSLGLVGDRRAVSGAWVQPAGIQEPDFMVLGSIGAGLAGDDDALPRLLRHLETDRLGWAASEIVVRSAGKLGDRRAIEPLVGILRDRSAPGSLRSAAAIALADLFDRESPLLLTRVTKDLNYSARPGAIRLLLEAF
ncbi:MAG: hypothetical protein ABFS86_02100 [Planctomycetota bacterium]